MYLSNIKYFNNYIALALLFLVENKSLPSDEIPRNNKTAYPYIVPYKAILGICTHNSACT